MTNVDTQNLAGIAELAELFSVGRTTISNWYARRQTNAYPEPVLVLAMGPIWDSTVVVDWWKRYKPLRNMVKVGSLPDEMVTPADLVAAVPA